MGNDINKLFGLFLLVMLVIIFWQPLVWLIIIFLVMMIVFALRIIIKSSKIKDEIHRDPDAYFRKYEEYPKSQDISSEDIIDVEYTEKEVKDDD